MDISDIVSTEFETFDVDATRAELDGYFRETGADAAIVLEDGEYQGIVTQRQLTTGPDDPDAKARALVWHVARVAPDEDVRRVARLMLGSRTRTLPVFEDDDLIGVVTAEALLSKVQPFLQVLTVEDVFSADLVSVAPETGVGELLHRFREGGITHLPVVEDGSTVGIVSLFDVLGFAGRRMQQPSGGDPAPSLQTGGGRSHGGFGERSGEVDRLLDLPAGDVMVSPVETVPRDTRLDEAVETMLDRGIASLVVVEDDRPVGIVTSSDVLRALTVTGETHLPVQVTNADLLDDLTRSELTDLIESVTSKYADLTVLEANVFLHEHDEKLRGTPLLMARIRLFTDKGHFVGTGEGYGASYAIHLALNVLERQILEGKAYGLTKKHPSGEEWSKLFGWWLTRPTRRR